MASSLPKGYQIRKLNSYYTSWHQQQEDPRPLLVHCMQSTYQELYPQQKNFAHLKETVQRYFSPQTPVWLVETTDAPHPSIAACLWMGTAIDQITGGKYAHIFLIFVTPQHRRRGIGKAMMKVAEDWAKDRGDRQIGLQVFPSNQAALNLYQNLGYLNQSFTMTKILDE
ncbi:MAG: GNAT family N-acetyltransferase [Pleurocapsa sp.]